MRKIDIKKFFSHIIVYIAISIYYVFTIPSNSIWNDQTLAVNLANNVLNGKFSLVGHLHSNRMTYSPHFLLSERTI